MGRVPTAETLFVPPYPWHTAVAPVILTLIVSHVPDWRRLGHPFPWSVLLSISASCGTHLRCPGGGVCLPDGPSLYPHLYGLFIGSPTPGWPPPGNGAASRF